jgi:hypothetical protein
MRVRFVKPYGWKDGRPVYPAGREAVLCPECIRDLPPDVYVACDEAASSAKSVKSAKSAEKRK